MNIEFTSNECVKERHPLSRAKSGPVIRHISESVYLKGGKLLLFTHKKSHRKSLSIGIKTGDFE